MVCPFCHKEFDESEGCCPCCGLKVAVCEGVYRLFRFEEKTLTTEYLFKAKKTIRELRPTLKCVNFGIEFYYCKKNIALGYVRDLMQLSAIDWDSLMVVIKYDWENGDWLNAGRYVMDIYDSQFKKIRGARLTEKLYLGSAEESIIRNYSKGSQEVNFCPISIETFAPVGKSKRKPSGYNSWDLSTLDKEMGVE